MSGILLFAFVAFLSWYSILGKSATQLQSRHGPATDDDDVPCTREYSCWNCTTARVCAPKQDNQSLYEIDRISCPPSYPWCDSTSGTCSNVEQPECFVPGTTSNFTCMRDGYFPDPINCSIYYLCVSDRAFQYICPPLTPYYNPEYQYCVPYNYYCANNTVNCSNYHSGQKAPIVYTNSYYVYCYDKKPIAVDRCIGAYLFDSYAQTCVPYCPGEGLFPKMDNCANYYKCSPKSHEKYSSYIMTDRTCPDGQGFSESEYSCVNRSLAPNCKYSNPDFFSK